MKLELAHLIIWQVVRLERAKELLRTTDQLVKQVSEAVGYEDDHVFIRRFKKYTGKTPGAVSEGSHSNSGFIG